MNHGMENLRNHGNNVDFIITHDGPQSDVSMLGENDSDPLREYLEFIKQTVEYRKWLFWHRHLSAIINEKSEVIYENVKQLVGADNPE